MRAVVQRVMQAGVTIDGNMKASIQHGLLVFVGIEDADGQEDIQWLSNKIVNLRIFDDPQDSANENKVPNISLKETGGDIMLVSQFTLHAATKKGNRPSYIRASKPEIAIPLYEKLVAQFGADMKISLLNNGPVTIWIDTKNKE
jgi:D-tyrosyl-tRNA(Tyr) deacylase